jgi:hypothetical protein
MEEKLPIEKLDSGNWISWKFQMKHLLMARDLWTVVDGSESLPTGERELNEYSRRVQKAMATLVLSVTSSKLYLITSCETPKDVWSNLRGHFEKDSLTNKIYLKKQYFRLEMKAGSSVEAHLKKMKDITDKLDAIGAPVADEDKVVTLLGSLPSTYSTLVTALEARGDDLTLSYVQQAVIHEEQKLNGRDEKSSLKDEALVGARKTYSSKKKSVQCFKCKKFGHFKINCPEVKSDSSVRNHKAKVMEDEFDEALKGIEVDVSKSATRKSSWIIDSGASSHMTWENTYISDFRELSPPQKVGLGDGRTVDAVGIGKIRMNMELDDQKMKSAVLYDVLYVPRLSCNLFSVKAAAQRGKRIKFGHHRCWIDGPNGDLCAKGTLKDKFYRLDCSPMESASVATAGQIDLWHQRFGHVNGTQLKEMVQKKLVEGVDRIQHTELDFCEGCINGKMQRNSFKPVGAVKSTRKLQLVHSDVCGPMQTESIGGCKYFVTFIDDYTRYCHAYFLKRKSDVFEKFKDFQTMIENETGRKIVTFRSDRGGEYLSSEFDRYLKMQGVKHEVSVAKCPEQNGVAERMNRTLMESARSMLSHSGLSNMYWAEAISTAVYLRNRLPTAAFKEKTTPYEKWHERKPKVDHLKVFGCVAYSHIADDERKKLDAKAEKLRFLGYSSESKGYRLYDEKKHQIKIRRNVKFNEADFTLERKYVVPSVGDSDVDIVNKQPDNDDPHMPDVDARPEMDHMNTPEKASLRRSGRERRSPVRYGIDEYVDSATIDHEVHHVAYHVSQVKEPVTLTEALNGDQAFEWKAAADAEFNSLMKNETWELVRLPKGRKPVSCKWVFKVKYGNDGQIDRFKGRLVARGFVQEYGIDYDETYSPVVRFTSIRTLLAFAAERKMMIHQMDVVTAFLNGILEEEIYMEQPEGYTKPGEEDLVCKLKKSLYGLKQAPRCWNRAFTEYMQHMGFKQSNADQCVFIRSGSSLAVVAVYVDDLIILTETEEEMKKVKSDFERKFMMKDMGELHYCLGINIVVNKDEGSVCVNQYQYISNMLKKYGLEDANPAPTPADVNVKLEKNDGVSQKADQKAYQSLVGSLLYASVGTRPDIAQAVGAVCKFNANPSEAHMTAAKRILRYLKGTATLCLKYQHTGEMKVIGYSDSDFAGDMDDRHSTTGNIFICAKGAISWLSKKQPTVSLSTTEAEYVALSCATQEVIWLRRLLSDLEVNINEPMVMMEDNQGAIALAQNPVKHSRTKHIDVKHHFVREAIQDGFISLQYCNTKEMVADTLTKPLPKCQFQRLRASMGICEL